MREGKGQNGSYLLSEASFGRYWFTLTTILTLLHIPCRSVISPDPYIGAGEIGVPPYFAKRLSFPERVTPWNVEMLREAVIRGHDELPGAVAVEDERGRVISLVTQPRNKREAIAKQLLSGTTAGMSSAGRAAVGSNPSSSSAGPTLGIGKIVYRHLQDGDLMLTNRQPTLHKPGLMAHRARVLKGERTIRMHYANCATFNADFDGDEINLHLPQVCGSVMVHIVHFLGPSYCTFSWFLVDSFHDSLLPGSAC